MADESGVEFEELPEDHPVLKALRAARSERNEARGKLHLAQVQMKYPTIGLAEADFEGLTPDKYEARAERLAALASASAAASTPPSDEPAPQDRPEVDALARMQQGLDSRPVVPGEQDLNLAEAQALYKRNPQEYMRLREAGRINLGVKAEDHGGSIIFGQG